MNKTESADTGEKTSDLSCFNCKHLVEWPYCLAFLSGAGIPEEIRRGEHVHTSPYPGDHGLRFTPIGSDYGVSGKVIKTLLQEYAGETILAGLSLNLPEEEPAGPLARLGEGDDIEIIPDLIAACSEGDIKAIKQFLDRGVDINAADRDGNTPLMVACRHCHPHVVEFLLKSGSDVNARDRYDKTALRIACEWGYPTIVNLLKEFGAEE